MEVTSQMAVTQYIIASDFVAVIKHLLHGHWEEEWTKIEPNKLRDLKDTIRPLISYIRTSH